MNTCALAGAANDGARQAAVVVRLRTVADSAGAPRSASQTLTKHLTLRCPTFWPRFNKRDASDPNRKKLCNALAGMVAGCPTLRQSNVRHGATTCNTNLVEVAAIESWGRSSGDVVRRRDRCWLPRHCFVLLT
jgi:hypothetical protein